MHNRWKRHEHSAKFLLHNVQRFCYNKNRVATTNTILQKYNRDKDQTMLPPALLHFVQPCRNYRSTTYLFPECPKPLGHPTATIYDLTQETPHFKTQNTSVSMPPLKNSESLAQKSQGHDSWYQSSPTNFLPKKLVLEHLDQVLDEKLVLAQHLGGMLGTNRRRLVRRDRPLITTA